MAKIEMSIKDEARPASPAPKVAVAPAPSPPFKQRAACFWSIKAGPADGTIVARSDMGDVFEGPTAEFNKKLRE